MNNLLSFEVINLNALEQTNSFMTGDNSYGNCSCGAWHYLCGWTGCPDVSIQISTQVIKVTEIK